MTKNIELDAELAAMKGLAEKIAAKHRARGVASDATEIDQLNAESAGYILKAAEIEATHIEAEAAHGIAERLLTFTDVKAQQLENAIVEHVEKGEPVTRGAIREVADKAIADINDWQADLNAMLLEQATAVWRRAVRNLRDLG